MVEKVISVISGNYGKASVVDSVTEINWGQSIKVDTSNSVNWSISKSFKDVVNSINYSRMNSMVVNTRVTWDEFNDKLHTIIELKNLPTFLLYVDSDLGDVDYTHSVDSINTENYYGILPYKDSITSDTFRQNYLYDNKPIPPEDNRFLAGGSDFNFTSELINFTSDFIDPINYDTLKTRISPVNLLSEFVWSRSKIVDIYQELKWGYSINNFLVGGIVKTYYPVDPEAVTPPPEPPVSQEVITFVNIINIVKLPERTPIQFDNLSLSYDIDSVAWNISFDIADTSTLNLIKPTQLNTTELEININGELFNVFIGKTNTTTSVDTKGLVRRRIKCSGWSVHKLLTYPYFQRRSHVETSSSTPAGILASELTGTGFTATWNSVSWTIPANTFTYIDKAPIAALSELVQSVGAVIIPTPDAKDFTIQPRYPTSPWNWGSVAADININEGSLFTIDTEWLPQESPDSIYCYGEANTGVAVKAVRQGQAGIKTLPTVVSKYFTDTIPATERGRIEIAKNGYKEIIPFSTYVDPVDGIIMPLQIIQVTELDNSTTWRGQVVGVSLNLKRNGNALVQTIQVERHYDL